MDRRRFLALIGSGAAWACSDRVGARTSEPQTAGRNALRLIPTTSGRQLTLTAAPTRADVGLGVVDAFTLNGSLPSPTIRLHEGETARIDLVNQLPEPTILHWHGLSVPEAADGHPRLAIQPGGSYRYDFTLRNAAGTYWYHPHTHMRTASQTYAGLGGFLIVEGDEEASLGLPRDEHEILLLLQDKRISGTPSLAYQLPMGPDMMIGLLGNTAFANGVADPTVEVERTRYRLRLLNGSTARIFDVALSTGEPLLLIGSDGGLLEAPVPVPRIMLAPAERADVLVDFSARSPGERIMLRSLQFEIPGMMTMGPGMMMGRGMRGRMGMGGGAAAQPLPQGAAMDLVELVVSSARSSAAPPPPSRLRALAKPNVPTGATRRAFRFDTMMMAHTINGRRFELERVDERVPLDETEVWTFVNESVLPHPVHVHGGQFHVLSRAGGRGRLMPWETGPKDTVLTLPGERVDVAVRFDFPGLFLLHCHNLEHEDSGMMLNFEVVD